MEFPAAMECVRDTLRPRILAALAGVRLLDLRKRK